MSTARETVLAALHSRLQSLAALTLREEVLPERIPAKVKVFRCGPWREGGAWRAGGPRWQTSQGGSRVGLVLPMGKVHCRWELLSYPGRG